MKKFAIIYGQLENDIQKRAVEELSSTLLDYTFEYPVCCRYDENENLSDYKRIYIGTKQSNAYIRNASKIILSKEEEYFIKVENSNIVIEGFDDAGVLYGVLDFYNKYIVKYEHPENDDKPAENDDKPAANSTKPVKKVTAGRGKRKTVDAGKLIALHKAGWCPENIAHELGCHVTTVYNYLRQCKDEGKL